MGKDLLRGGLLVAMLAGAVASAGCGRAAAKRTAARPAADGVKDFIAALRADDPRPAYALLSREVRKQVDFASFAKRWKTTGAERKFQAAALEEGLKTEPNVGERSRVVYPDGQSVHLLREGNVWRLESALVSKHHAGRAEDAVRLFADAMGAHDFDAVMQLLTNGRRSSLSKQLDRFVTSLVANKNTGIEYLGKDRAELHWEDKDHRYAIVLLREGDSWRVDDIRIRALPQKNKKPTLTRPLVRGRH